MAVAEVLHLEAVLLVLLVVEGIELVDGDLVELVEVRFAFAFVLAET